MALIDAGPLVALVDRDDRHHAACVTAFAELAGPVATVWPALVEAFYLVRDLPAAARDRLWELVERAVTILPLDEHDVPRIRELMRKYGDLPMDLADAALVRVGEREGIATIFSVDRRDFSVYRLHGRRRFRVLP